jgi:hypothetical protein
MYICTVIAPTSRYETEAPIMQSTFSSAITPYPVRVEGHLEHPSRGLWLIKWLLALPHAVVLAVLWLGVAASSAAAFVTVLFGRAYPRPLFDYNVGVMRWSWRVAFYAYAANGTDRYPPFTLGDVPDYPARLDVAYPDHQRSGFALIGWWLAGVPQYLIVGVLLGGGVLGGTAWIGATWSGLIGLLVLAGAIVLLSGRAYPRSIFDLVLGLDRWVLRVVAYAAVMAPEYPPFRLDIGEHDVAGPMTTTPHALTDSSASQPPTWSATRIITSAASSIAALIAITAVAAGATAITFDQTQRNAGGYLTSASSSFATPSAALLSDSYRARGGEGLIARELLGTIQIHTQSNRPVFVGIAPASAASAYLAGVAHAQATRLVPRGTDFKAQAGGRLLRRPAAEHFWVASTSGAGARTLTWKIRDGNWRIVVMNANGTAAVASEMSIGASFPHLLMIGIALLAAGILTLLLSAGVLIRVLRRKR